MTLWTPSFVQAESAPGERLGMALNSVQGVQPGVIPDFDVPQPFVATVVPGTMNVNVSPGRALVPNGILWGEQDVFHVVSDAVTGLTFAANSSGSPRLDQIAVTVSGGVPSLSIYQGIPNAATTINNRTGAVSLPTNALRLYDAVVPNGATTVTDIRDRRRWAHGAHYTAMYTGAPVAITSTTAATLMSPDLVFRVESANPSALEFMIQGSIVYPAAAGVTLDLQIVLGDTTTWSAGLNFSSPSATSLADTMSVHMYSPSTVPAGSILVKLTARLLAANATGITLSNVRLTARERV